MSRALIIAALFAATPAAAEMAYLSEKAICGADDGVIEESNAILLYEEGMGNHFFDCSWDKNLTNARLRQGFFTTKAKCANGISSWDAEFEIVVEGGDMSRINVYQNSGGASPIVFYRCGG